MKPSAIIAANVDLDSLAADDLEYNYDVAGLAGGCTVQQWVWVPVVPQKQSWLHGVLHGFLVGDM